MASLLLSSVCAFLLLHVLRERFRLNGQVKAARTAAWLTAAAIVLLPALSMVALTLVAPGYLQSMAGEKWMIGGAVLAQIAVNFSIWKIIDLKVQIWRAR
jgi:Flp pilus assembly protein TadB